MEEPVARILPRPSLLLTTIVLGASLYGFAAPPPASGGALVYQEDFEDGQAQGWNLESGWQVVREEGGSFLEGEGHFWARGDQALSDDFRLTFRLRLERGRIHLVVRNNDIGRYFIGLDSQGADLNRQEWPSTFKNGLATTTRNHTTKTWHSIEIVGQTGRLDVSVDGRKELSYTDPAPLAGGTFAFETLDDSIAQVDDIELYDLGLGVSASTAVIPAATAPSPKATSLSTGQQLSWMRTGGPLGGLGYDVRMHPDNPDLMMVTDAMAGVFRTEDGGRSWVPSSSGITTRSGETGDLVPVFSLTIDASDPNIVWAGTQFQRGIFKSTDGGLTWKKTDSGVIEREGITFRGFGIDPHDSQIVYAAAELSSWVWGPRPRNGREFDMTKGVVYKTTNGGASWRAVWRGDNLARYVLINPRDSNVVYVSTGIFDREAGNSDPVQGTPGGVGVLKSTDGGTTWTAMTRGMDNLYVGSLFMHPTNPDILLAGTGNVQYPHGNGVYLTVDGAQTWQRTLADEMIESVEFAGTDGLTAYAGSNDRFFMSADGGRNWALVSGGENGWGAPGVRAGHPIDFQVDPRDPLRVFANLYGGGNFLSADGGRSWVAASQGYTGAMVRSVVVDLTNPARALAAARSGGFGTTDGGTHWFGLSSPPAYSSEWTVVAIDPAEPLHLLASNNWQWTLFESHDGGTKWQQTNTGLTYQSRTGWRALAFAPSQVQRVYAGAGGFYSAGVWDASMPGAGIWISQNGGHTWAQSSEKAVADAHVADLAVDPTSAERVFAATLNHGVLRSEDGGAHWEEVTAAMGRGLKVLSVEVDPDNPMRVFAGRNRGGLLLSENGGDTWRAIGAGLNPEASVTTIVVDPTDSRRLYLADLLSGVYRSVDGGRTWRAMSAGLVNRAVNSLALSADAQHLYAGTEGAGVFRLDVNGVPPEAVSIVPAPASPTAPRSTPQPQAAATTQGVMASQTPSPSGGGKPGLCASAGLLPLTLVAWHHRKQHKK